jgi:protein SCO1/2
VLQATNNRTQLGVTAANTGTNRPRRSVEWLVWGGLVLTIVAIAVAFILSGQRPSSPLPVITSGLPSFSLTNQSGAPITAADFSNHVSVVDVIFTRCPGPCPKMTARMAQLQHAFPASFPVKLVTLTTDPEYDSVPVLKRYAEDFKADPARWWFLTGQKGDIARLARDGLKLVAQETKPEERENDTDLFIHSTIFVVVDKHGRLRGAIESTDLDFHSRVRDAVRRLLREK